MLSALNGSNEHIAACNAKRALEYRCPECKKKVKLRADSSFFIDHFSHISKSDCAYRNNESPEHLKAKMDLYGFLMSANGVTNVMPEMRLDNGSRPDVTCVIRGIQCAFELQKSSLTLDKARSRTTKISEMGYYTLWISISDSRKLNETLELINLSDVRLEDASSGLVHMHHRKINSSSPVTVTSLIPIKKDGIRLLVHKNIYDWLRRHKEHVSKRGREKENRFNAAYRGNWYDKEKNSVARMVMQNMVKDYTDDLWMDMLSTTGEEVKISPEQTINTLRLHDMRVFASRHFLEFPNGDKDHPFAIFYPLRIGIVSSNIICNIKEIQPRGRMFDGLRKFSRNKPAIDSKDILKKIEESETLDDLYCSLAKAGITASWCFTYKNKAYLCNKGGQKNRKLITVLTPHGAAAIKAMCVLMEANIRRKYSWTEIIDPKLKDLLDKHNSLRDIFERFYTKATRNSWRLPSIFSSDDAEEIFRELLGTRWGPNIRLPSVYRMP